MKATPLRVLCLHSFRTSARLMRQQMAALSNWAAALEPNASLSYLDAPYECTEADEAKIPERLRRVFPGPYHEWWNARDEQGRIVYDHLDASIEAVRAHAAREGPFDGVLGFSQGGSLAHMLCALRLLEPAPRFAILIGCRVSRHHEHIASIQALRAAPCPTPALVVIGEADTDVPPADTYDLAATMRDPEVIVVPKGTHRIPMLAEEHAATLSAFVARAARGEASGAAGARL